MLMKTKWYPKPHDLYMGLLLGAEPTGEDSTIIPVIHQDEAMAPGSVYSNPMHASFAESSESNCCPESRINSLYGMLELSLTKGALQTDKITSLKVGVQVIKTAFSKDLDEADEITGTALKTICGLAYETNDKQVYPLWNGNKITEKYSGSGTYGANMPALTTNQIAEQVSFDEDQYYDALQYYTNAGLLKKITRGLKWYRLTQRHPIIRIPIKIDNAVKRMNEYSFFGVRIHVPRTGTEYQDPASADTTNISHLLCDARFRYFEWNEHFNMERV